jgi:hypothetical protein
MTPIDTQTFDKASIRIGESCCYQRRHKLEFMDSESGPATYVVLALVNVHIVLLLVYGIFHGIVWIYRRVCNRRHNPLVLAHWPPNWSSAANEYNELHRRGLLSLLDAIEEEAFFTAYRGDQLEAIANYMECESGHSGSSGPLMTQNFWYIRKHGFKAWLDLVEKQRRRALK